VFETGLIIKITVKVRGICVTAGREVAELLHLPPEVQNKKSPCSGMQGLV